MVEVVLAILRVCRFLSSGSSSLASRNGATVLTCNTCLKSSVDLHDSDIDKSRSDFWESLQTLHLQHLGLTGA